MSDSCPTVRIADAKAPGGFVVINEADYDAKAHKIYADPLDHDGDGKKGGAKAQPAPDPLDVPQPEAGGLTIREVHADLEAAHIEIDPSAPVTAKAALRKAAK